MPRQREREKTRHQNKKLPSQLTQKPRFARPSLPRTNAIQRNGRLPKIIPRRRIIRRDDIDMDGARIRR